MSNNPLRWGCRGWAAIYYHSHVARPVNWIRHGDVHFWWLSSSGSLNLYYCELRVQKVENRESNGALDFDGLCCMGGHTNQPKVGQNNGIYFGVMACRAMTIGESAVASFGPTNFWTKNQ